MKRKLTKKFVAKYSETGFGAILENIRSDFQLFGEELIAVREKGNATFEAVGVLQEDITIIKEDIKEMRNVLEDKVSRKDEFIPLEKRVAVLENK